ncbi:NUDIX hydrolase [Curtobacterium pusillum]|uniref:NUDIX hydrolase n=1 Tax=Curtobacterium pusillum TaxID=69373 RepID=UPI0011A31926|nr:NUDIX hydrolase [Curtobacterium pusillum]
MTGAPTAARDQPLIAIDVVPVSFAAGSGLRVATAPRQYAPYVGQEALPGVLLAPAERLADGARRALRSKAGIDAAAVRHLAQIGAFDGPERDPRSTAISVAFAAVVDPSAVGPGGGGAVDRPSSVWRLPDQGEPRLPFDHDTIIRAALEHVRTRIWRDLPLTRALLGEVFTSSDAAQLQTALTGTAPDPGNTNRALRTNPALVRADAPSSVAGRGGRPPVTWTWVD